MKAVALTRYLPIDDPQSLIDVELEKPVPRGRDLLVRVEAVSINPVDAKMRAPKAQIEATPKVLGYDAAGVVEAVGDAAALFKPGDEVFYAGDVTRPGTNAQYHLVDERIVGRKPRTLDFAHAAAVPLTALTAWELLFERFAFDSEGAHRGRTLLAMAGAGGLGSIAIQLAKRAQLTVIATASRAESIAWCRALGADHVIDHRQPLRPQLEALGFGHVDAIGSFSSPEPYWTQYGDIVAPQGKIGILTTLQSALDMNLLKNKSASVHWEFMFTRAMFGTHDMIRQHEILTRVAALIDAGELKSNVTRVLSPIGAATMREAHRLIESGATIGKIAIAGW
ncbi:MAG TPA: zinc-binding alcohol dehydrogenase family protein [Rudaea sp.]|nr:zinc-binding alcohol dehydrogenase family protein [Rudaea sp.]